MATSMVNWARSANWCLMQLENTFIPHVIAKLLKPKASISSRVRNKRFCKKTKNTAPLLLKFTIKSNDPEKLLWKVMSAYRNFKVLRVQKWMRTSTQDSEIQLSSPRLQLKHCQVSAPPSRKMPCLKESCGLRVTFVMFWNSQQKRTIF